MFLWKSIRFEYIKYELGEVILLIHSRRIDFFHVWKGGLVIYFSSHPSHFPDPTPTSIKWTIPYKLYKSNIANLIW